MALIIFCPRRSKLNCSTQLVVVVTCRRQTHGYSIFPRAYIINRFPQFTTRAQSTGAGKGGAVLEICRTKKKRNKRKLVELSTGLLAQLREEFIFPWNTCNFRPLALSASEKKNKARSSRIKLAALSLSLRSGLSLFSFVAAYFRAERRVRLCRVRRRRVSVTNQATST